MHVPYGLLQILVDVHMVISVVLVSSSFLESSSFTACRLRKHLHIVELCCTYSHNEIKSYLGGLLAHSGAAAAPNDQHLGLS